MIQRLMRWFEFSQYERVGDRLKARYIVTIMGAIILISLIYSTTVAEWLPSNASPDASPVAALALLFDQPVLLGVLVVSTLLNVAMLLLVRFKQLLAAGITATTNILLITAGMVLILPELAFDHLMYVVSLVNAIFLAFLLTNQVGGLVVVGVAILMLLADSGTAPLEQITGTALALVGSGIIGVLYLRTFDIRRAEGQVAAGGERSRLADVIHRLTRIASDAQSLEPTLVASLRAIQTDYPRFQALGIYLLDEGELFAELAQSLGVVRTIDQGRFAVGDVSPVGQATLTGQLQVRTLARTGVQESTSLLPGMRQQIVIPLMFGSQLLGALDLQSAYRGELSDSDQQAFVALADALAFVIHSVRQAAEMHERTVENVRLAEQARNALNEVQRLNKRLIGRAWSEYVQENSTLRNVEYDAATGAILSVEDSTPYLDTALAEETPLIAKGVISFPVRVRGQVVGAIEVDLPPEVEVDQRQAPLLNELGDRIGLALENVRLLERSQRSAQREALINLISTRIQTATNVEAMLAETARGLNEMLSASYVSIRLGKPDAPQHVSTKPSVEEPA